MSLKDQSGAAASGEWLAATGGTTYGPRESGRSLMDRVTRPITRDWYEAVVQVGECRRCQSKLVRDGNPGGGAYMRCSQYGHHCYYIGWREDSDSGEERIVG